MRLILSPRQKRRKKTNLKAGKNFPRFPLFIQAKKHPRSFGGVFKLLINYVLRIAFDKLCEIVNCNVHKTLAALLGQPE